MHWFGAGVDACWFTLKMCPNAKADYTVKIFDDIFDEGATSSARFGIVDSRLVSDVDQYLCVREADGKVSIRMEVRSETRRFKGL